MKSWLLFFIACSSFFCYGQNSLNGDYYIEYHKDLKISRESKVKIWGLSDTLKKHQWSFNAFQRDKWSWEFAGYAVLVDSSSVELFVDTYKNFSPNVEKKLGRRIKKDKPFYIITRMNDSLYIENRQGGKKVKLRLVKIV